MTVNVPLVKVTSVIVAVQLLLGHPPCLPVIELGPAVSTQKERFPFLISLCGITWVPLVVTEPGFCPGDSLPPGLVHVTVGTPVAVSVMTTSPLPSPAIWPHD